MIGTGTSLGPPGPATAGRYAIVAIATLFLGLAAGCAQVPRNVPVPSASLQGIAVESFDLTSLTLRFELEVRNPYAVELPLESLEYAVDSDGRRFVEGVARVGRTLAARDTATVGIPVRLTLADLADVVSGVRPGAVIPYEAELGLRVDAPVVGSVRLPMHRDGEIRLPSL